MAVLQKLDLSLYYVEQNEWLGACFFNYINLKVYTTWIHVLCLFSAFCARSEITDFPKLGVLYS